MIGAEAAYEDNPNKDDASSDEADKLGAQLTDGIDFIIGAETIGAAYDDNPRDGDNRSDDV